MTGNKRAWKTAGEQEDWLREKGKLLGIVAETLANGLREEFPVLPAQVEYLIFGFITPVAAEYTRRSIFSNSTLTDYQKQMLELFAMRTYSYVIDLYGGDMSDPERCIYEILNTPMAPDNPAFHTRMRRVTPLFETFFRPENRKANFNDDETFLVAFLVQVMQIIRENDKGHHDFNIDNEDLIRLQRVFESSSNMIQRLLTD
jgi:hypothetical protein